MTAPTPPPMARDHQHPGETVRRRMTGERGRNRDRHADHAEEIALAGTCGTGQPAQRQDEQHTRHEIQYCSQIGVHLRSPFSFVTPRCTPLTLATLLGLLLVHRQHALGDKEAAEDIHLGEDQRDETEAARPA
jgi:hypothetical protein